MVTPELQNYVSEQRALGVDEAALREALLQNGWPVAAVDEVLTIPKVSSKPTQDLHPRRFLYLVIAGIVVLIAIGVVIAVFFTRSQIVPFGG